MRPGKPLTALAGAAVLTLTLTASSCDSSTSSNGNAITDGQQANQDTQYAYVQPLPYFPFSQIRQTLIEAEAINALGIASTTFDFVQGIDHPVLVCPSIGVPVPATDELSNPVVPVWNGSSGTNNVSYSDAGVGEGQQEPDGVFPGDTTGTDGLCVNDSGGQYLNYDEAEDISVTAPAYWDATLYGGKGGIHITGTPVMPICTVKILSAVKKQAEEVCTDPNKSK